MKKLFGTLSTFLLSVALVLSPIGFMDVAVAAPETAVTLAAKLSKAGLGCKDLKATSAKILYGGKRWTCTIKGIKTNVEFYTAANLKKAGAYLCSSGVDLPLVTDGKSWTIYTGDSAVDSAVAKALKGSIKKACKC